MKKFLRTEKSIYVDVEKIQSISYIEIKHSLGFFMENEDSYQVMLPSEITRETIEKYMPYIIHYCFAKKESIIDIYEQTQNGFLSSDKALYESVCEFLLDSVFGLIMHIGISYSSDNIKIENNEIILSKDTEQERELLYLVKFRHSRVSINIFIDKDTQQNRKEILIKELEEFSDKLNELDLKAATTNYRD